MYKFVKPLDAVTVPATVQAILASRIDRLSAEDKRLLQAAAVVGKDVPVALLRAIAEVSDDGLHRGLGRLQSAEFLYEVRLFPELEYTFKHALTHDVAYGSLLGDRRRALHTAVVVAIERLHHDRLDEYVERLAHHAVRGELPEAATRYLHRAGDKAAAGSANHEAVALFEQAVPLLDRLPATPDLLARAADVHLGLGMTRIGIKGTGHPDVETAYRRAREIADRLGDPIRLFQALWGLWFVNFGRGHYMAALELAGQLLSIAEQENDTGRLLEAHHSLWPTLASMGRSVEALPHYERGLALYDPDRHAGQAFLYGGHDAGVCCRYHNARSLWILGFPAQAVARAHDALALADRLAHAETLMHALGFLTTLEYQLGRWEASEQYAQRMQAITDAQGSTAWRGDVAATLSAARLRRGVSDGFAESYERLMTGWRASTATRSLTNRIVFADAACAAGDTTCALDVLESLPAELRDVLWASEIRRIRGDALVARGRDDEAEACFRDAIAITRRRAERSLELRATTRLARLLARSGRRDEARRELAAISGWFTEGFDTMDFRDARAVLDELGGPAG